MAVGAPGRTGRFTDLGALGRETVALRYPDLRLEPAVATAVVVTAAVVIGVVAAVSVEAAVALSALAGLAWLAWRCPSGPLIVWAGLLFLEDLRVPNLAIKALMPAVVVALLRPAFDGVRRQPVSGPFTFAMVSLGLLSAWLVASTSWAIDVGHVLEFSKIWIPMAVLFLAIAYRAPSVDSIRLVGLALVVGATASVALGVIDGYRAEGSAALDARLAGGSGDPNFLAAGLPTALLFALLWFRRLRRARSRIVVAAAMATLLLGLLLTASRGGLLALASLVPLAIVFAGPARRRIAVVSLAATATVAVLLLLTPAADRVLTSDGGTGREELWLIAGEMISARPLVGFGPDNFLVVAPDYVRSVGPLVYVDLVVDRPHQVHNIYLQMAAETGLIGMALYLSFIGGCIAGAVRASSVFAGRGDAAASLLARIVAMAGLSMLVAATFLPFLLDRRFWLVLALGPALDRLAGRASPGEDELAVDRAALAGRR